MNDYSSNQPLASDRALLQQLGLPVWNAEFGKELHIGEVRPFAPDEPEGMETVVQVYVRCFPAEFYRFVIVRRSEAAGYTGMEQLEMKTGSGSLSMYWPMVLAVAGNALTLSPVQRLA